MGSGHSTYYKLPPPRPEVPYFVVMFQVPCGIRLGLADQETIDAVRRACSAVVPAQGIEFDGKLEDDSYKIRLRGKPFALASDHKDALISRKVTARMLQELYAIGWKLVMASDLSRNDDLSTWFFKRIYPPTDPPRIVCVGLSSSDTLQMVGDFDDCLKNTLKTAVQAGYAPGLQNVRDSTPDYYELKLHGYPWVGNNTLEEGTWARRCLLQVIRSFHDQRFDFYGTVNLKGTADALFFIEMSTWAERTLNVERSSRRTGIGEKPVIQDVGPHFCAISLDRRDRLTLIDCAPQIVDCVRDSILNNWKGGLQAEKSVKEKLTHPSNRQRKLGIGAAVEFKMKGYPWWTEGPDTVQTRIFLSKLFQSLLTRGYLVIGALDISRQFNDKAVFILRSHPAADLTHVCLSMHDVDKIRLINTADAITAENVTRTIEIMWPYGLVDHCEDVFTTYQWTLKNQPWSSYGRTNRPLIARVLMCYVLRSFLDRGWSFLVSADVSAKYVAAASGPDFSCDVDCWFLVDSRRLGGMTDVY